MGMDVKSFRGVLTSRFSISYVMTLSGYYTQEWLETTVPRWTGLWHILSLTSAVLGAVVTCHNTHPYSSCVCTNTLKSTGYHIQRPQYLQIECGLLHDCCKHELLSLYQCTQLSICHKCTWKIYGLSWNRFICKLIAWS